ncbi:hypothetical protein [Jeotgalibacillus proteolyticus]|uniref:Uncharacterized protein n=1 Tax=Jeotgalibacillus proteolyticus TaxID=2082395 RepID=A0A2S5G995_9BACL|nr:hypothetical protein [Jeotgalibacillus proteolyticus]PPA69570.1 hypothetical protein C4B60_13560 [Jeotgalibacillus proteolyticus]
MNKFLKITAGSLLAAALMVGCNMDNNARDDDNGPIDNAVDRTQEEIDRGGNYMNDRANDVEDDMTRDNDVLDNNDNNNIEENNNGIIDDNNDRDNNR